MQPQEARAVAVRLRVLNAEIAQEFKRCSRQIRAPLLGRGVLGFEELRVSVPVVPSRRPEYLWAAHRSV